MQVPVQISIRDIESSASLEERIRDKADKLDESFGHIMSCRVAVEMPHKHNHHGRQFNVRIDIGVPGREIAVNRSHHGDVYAALRDAFDAARRLLEEHARKMRGAAKTRRARYPGEAMEA